MNRTAKRCLSCAVTLLLLGLCLHAAAAVLERKDNSAESELTYADVRLAPFFDSKTPYDVLFMGTSHMIYGVNPMRMWQDEGITSYNLGGNNNTMPIEYWMLKEAVGKRESGSIVDDAFGF